ncbi:MAG: NUDIX hydrolase [Treponema sp.]|nr:NUDIX hydrolase [Treponema sp.]
MKDEKTLVWKEKGRKKVFDCRVFSVYESYCVRPRGNNPDELRTFSVIDTSEWAIVVPVAGDNFVMVRQWRHSSQSICLEFPGGVFEPGENPAAAAARELLEETGYRPGTIRKIGEFSPNPAIMANKVHFFLAEDLVNTGRQELDPDEFVEVELVSIETVKKNMGKPPFSHALMGSALLLYLQSQDLI